MISSSSRSSPSPGTRPRISSCAPAFVAQAVEMLDKIAARTARAAAVIGFPEPGRDLHNAAAVCANGRVYGVYRKQLLPNYGVFDEQRYFVAPRTSPLPLFNVAGVKVGISICEDAWSPTGPDPRRGRGRRRADREPQRVAVLRAATRRARDDARDAPPTRRCRSSTRTSSAARTSSCSTARRSCSTSRECSSRARSSS